MQRIAHRLPELALLLFLVFAVLWRGGKTLDTVWLQALLAVGLTVTATMFRRERRAIPVWIFSVGVLFLFWTLLSFILSTTKNYGFDEVIQTASLLLIFFWVHDEASTHHDFTGRVVRILSITLLLACAIGIAVYVLQPVSRFVGTFFNYRFHTDYWPNAWGEFVLLTWPLLLWSLFSGEKPAEKIKVFVTRAIVFGFVLGCFLLSYSRGSTIAFIGQMFLLAFLLGWSNFHERSKKHAARVLLAVAVLSVTALVTFLGVNAVRSHFHEVESVSKKVMFASAEGSSSVSERREFWNQSVMLTALRPVVGFGPYSFRFVAPRLQTEVLAASDHPHNVLLKLSMERGIPGALLFLGFLILVVIRGLRGVGERHPEHSVCLRLLMVVGIVGVIAHNLIDYNLQFVGIALPMWVLMGLLTASPQEEKRMRKAPSRLLLVTALLLFIFMLYEGAMLALSSKARKYEAAGMPREALEWYAYTEDSLYPRDGWLSRGILLLGQQQFGQAESAADEYIRSNTQDSRGWRLLGDIYLAWKKRPDALRAYEKAFDDGKYNDAGIAKGLAYLLTDERAKLLERRFELDSLLNDYAFAILQNTHFIALSKNVEETISLAELLANQFPAERQQYQSLIEQIQTHAEEERATYSARPRGLLW